LTIYQSHPQMYVFRHLPAYAAFLLQQHLDDYIGELIRLSYEVKLPLLNHLKHLSEADLVQFVRKGSITYLTYLSENRAKQQIEDSLQQWLTNQMQIIGKDDVMAEDITIINYVRARTLKRWMREYSSELDVILELNAEIDDLKLGQNTTFANAYIQVLKERIEEELHFSHNLINASPSITYIFDLKDQRITYINGKVEAILGYTTQDVLGKETNLIADFIHPDDQPVVAQLIKHLIADQQGKTYQAEFRLINKQETYDWLRSYCVVYKRDEAGNPIQVLVSGYKINEEKKTATTLQNQEKLLLEAQAIAHIGSYEWDIINDTLIGSPELHKILGAGRRQTLDEIMERVHPDDQKKLHIALQRAFTSGQHACEFRYLSANGEKVIDGKGVVTFNSEGEPVLMTGTVQDITARKRIEENLLKKTLELEHSNIQLQEFASVASHDLKEPLRKIAMFSDIIITSDWDVLPEKTKTNISKITESAQRMQQLIEGILTYSAVGAEGKMQYCSLEAILQEALSNLEYRLKDTNAVVTSDGLPKADVIPFQMQQLFQNLISNSFKFSRKGTPPRVQLTHRIVTPWEADGKQVQHADRYLQILVCDNGIGFNNEASEKIFGLFQRLHGKSSYEGSGIGLAICRKIVENHGGQITATSEQDKGATFVITLPLADKAE
jgi:PAS domain S-box-containing protein